MPLTLGLASYTAVAVHHHKVDPGVASGERGEGKAAPWGLVAGKVVPKAHLRVERMVALGALVVGTQEEHMARGLAEAHRVHPLGVAVAGRRD